MTSKQITMSHPATTIVVVKDKAASEVARAMIESGDQTEPFYLFDLDTAYECVKKFKEKMPRVQIFYAMKANDHDVMLKLAIALGLGFDCASPGEINKTRIYNIPPTSIIYAVTMKTPEQMLFARQSGVRHTTFDSLGELNRLKQYWPDSKLLIRIKVESDSVYKLGDKFGCDYMEAMTLLDKARNLAMDVVGVAFHVGSACFSSDSYTQGLETARALFDHEARAGRNMHLLDIGGGFFNYNSTNFNEAADIINSGLVKWFPNQEVQVIAEPGRFICESAFTLYTNIRDVRKVTDSEKEVNMVYLNNGANNSLRYIEKWHTMNKFKKIEEIGRNKNITQNTIIWGPTLDDNDFVGPIKMAPTSVEDWLVFNDQGAYIIVFKTEYCGMERTYTRSVVSEQLWLALREKPVFSSSIFIMDSDMPSLILPSVLPPVLACHEKLILKDHCFEGFKIHVSAAFVLECPISNNVAKAIIEGGEQKQPFYIFNIDEANRRVSHFRDMMPRINMYYGIKSNDTDMMLKFAASSELGFSCASPEEIYKIRKLNVNPKKIIYAMPCKTAGEMEYARKVGVHLTTFDSFYELKKLKKYWPDARLLLHTKIESTKKKYATKFGCDFGLEATHLLDEAARFGLNVVGVSFQIDRASFSPQSYVLGLQQARALFDYEAKNGRRMNMVNIGGGFLSDRTDQIDEISYIINDALEELFPDQTVQVIAEPGRYLCDSAFKLFCSIIGVRQDTSGNAPVHMIYLNDGVHGTMRFDDDLRKLRKFQRSSEFEPILDERTILWGPTGDSIDRVLEHQHIKLPRCSSNDWLVMDNHGAYTFTYSTRFSTLEVPAIRPIISKDLWKSIKSCPVFQPSDFILNPDISEPLPSSLPAVISAHDSSIYEKVVTLKL